MLLSLRDLASELQMLNAETTGYLNTRTGETALFSEEEIALAENGADEFTAEWQTEIAEKVLVVRASDDWIELPSAFDFNDYRIMRDFCESVPPDAGGERLMSAIRGSGAFRRFRDEIVRLDFETPWYAFRDAAYERILADWLTARDLPFD